MKSKLGRAVSHPQLTSVKGSNERKLGGAVSYQQLTSVKESNGSKLGGAVSHQQLVYVKGSSNNETFLKKVMSMAYLFCRVKSCSDVNLQYTWLWGLYGIVSYTQVVIIVFVLAVVQFFSSTKVAYCFKSIKCPSLDLRTEFHKHDFLTDPK